MKKETLHIISFDNPFPPVYGGVIDVFFKIKALYELGFEIYLHCFVKEIPIDNCVLKNFVKEIYFYEKKYKFLNILSFTPFSVVSRYDENMIFNINRIEGAILFEGLQSTYVLNKQVFKNRNIFLRLHNLESDYYNGLYKSEKNYIKKLLLGLEALKYKPYQEIIRKFDAVFTLSHFETDFVNFHYNNAHYIPVFHGNPAVVELSSFGKFAIYHGDLRLADNKRAVLFLIDVFIKIPDYQLVIASKDGKFFVESHIQSMSNVSFFEIENYSQLEHLLSEAHINVMLSFQKSGTKLKVVNSLYKSRHCIINKNMVDDEKICNLCTIAENEIDFITNINKLRNEPYLDSKRREIILNTLLNDEKNAVAITTIMRK